MLVFHGDAAMHGLRVSRKVIIPSERCCINVFRMSWVRVRFSGTMAWLTHAYTLPPFVSRFLHFQHTCTHSAGSRILIFFLALWKRCCSPDYLSASHSLQNFSKSDICLSTGWLLVQFCSCWLFLPFWYLHAYNLISASLVHIHHGCPSECGGQKPFAAERAESEALWSQA